jgi:hypothetical protein
VSRDKIRPIDKADHMVPIRNDGQVTFNGAGVHPQEIKS